MASPENRFRPMEELVNEY